MNNIVRLPSTVLETHETPITEDWESVLDRVRRAMADAEYVKVDPARLRPMEGQPREYFDEIQRLRGDVGAREILNRQRHAITAVPMPRARMDIDTPDDYARIGS